MEVFRLSREKFTGGLTGKGAALKGARWNSVGVELIYAAVNRSLAMAEIAVHFTLATLPGDYVMMTLFIPDDISIQKLSREDLSRDWNTFPYHTSSQLIGDKFVADHQHCLLLVPSAVTPGDYNLLINLNHPDFKKIYIKEKERFPFDKRIFR